LPGNGRVTQKDLVVGGYLIPKGVGSVAVFWRELQWCTGTGFPRRLWMPHPWKHTRPGWM